MIPAICSAMRCGATQQTVLRGLHSVTRELRETQEGVLLTGVQKQQQEQQEQQQEQQQRPLRYPHQRAHSTEETMNFQASLSTRSKQINRAISELHLKLVALEDNQSRDEVEDHLKSLARQSLFISEASRELDAILMERDRAS